MTQSRETIITPAIDKCVLHSLWDLVVRTCPVPYQRGSVRVCGVAWPSVL